MKRLLLLLSILISVLGIWWILTLNLFGWAFNWVDFLFYLVPVVIDYLIIRWVGGGLNKKFNKIVEAFVKGESLELKIDRGLFRTYGLLLISLLPFLVFLLLFALYAAITFSLYGFIIILEAPRIPVAIILALFVIPFGTLLGVVIGIYRLIFPKKAEPFGIEVKRHENNKLWKLVDEVSFFLQTRTIDKIILTPEPGIGVYLKGNNIAAVKGGGFRTLEIGLPSIDGLTVSQFKAILAHEYGHFSNKDTQWSAFTFAMGQGLTQAIASTPGPSREESGDKEEKGGLFSFIVALNPAWWIMFLYTKLYFAVTGGFQRAKEVRADLKAIELTGGKDFAGGLKKITINDYVFSEFIQKHLVWDMLKKNQVITNFSKIIRHAESALSKEEITNIENAALATGETSSWDTHPETKTRLEYADRFKTIFKNEEESVASLFDNWDEVNEKVAKLYNQRLVAVVQTYAALQKQRDAQATNAEVKK